MLLSFAFLLEGMMFYNHNSYAYHVEQAKKDTERLELILEGKTIKKPLGASLLGIYEADDDFGDIELRNLTKNIVNATEYAIENADDIRETKGLKEAIDSISDVQEGQVGIIKDALHRIQAEPIAFEVEKTYHKAVELREKVSTASEQVQAAYAAGQKTIEIDIETEKDEHHGEKEHKSKHQNKDTADQEMATIHKPEGNPHIERILQQKEEDAAQREANRKRIRLIEEGRDAHKAQQAKNKLTKTNH